MVNVIIPLYNSDETLPRALDSLVAQTYKYFKVVLVNDCDDIDYDFIIKEYRLRGLDINYIERDINGGPGMARQTGIDNSVNCDYCMFLDADDMLMPQAIDILYNYAKNNNYDIVSSTFLKDNGTGIYESLTYGGESVTWIHGKIYKLKYLQQNAIRFLEELKFQEDAYFNLVAWNCTTARNAISIPTAIWIDNINSTTRKDGEDVFMQKYGAAYITSQIKALKKIYQITHRVDMTLFIQTLFNIYYEMSRQIYYNNDLSNEIQELLTFKNEDWVQSYFKEYETWSFIAENFNGAKEFSNGLIIFFKQPFNLWLQEYIIK